FDLIAARKPASQALPAKLACPRCAGPLAVTHDMQGKGTRFGYWKCAKHGHFITFLQFLKEKDFVRPLSAEQIADLRQNVATLNCSNCGGPIDLARHTTCSHCGSPLSMIDMAQIAAQVRELQQQTEEAAKPPSDGVRTTSVVTTWTIRGGGRTETIRKT